MMKVTYNKPVANPTPYGTQIWLCKSELDMTSGHQVLFSSRQEQIDYFTSPVRAIALPDNRYIKNKNGELTLEKQMADIEGHFNYLIYRNPSHENKYIICNILDYQYASDIVTRIYYAMDAFQTYQFDLDFSKENYIARRHFSRNEHEAIKNLPYEDLDRGRNNILATETVHQISGGESYFVITLSNPIVKGFSGNYTPLRNLNTTFNYVDENNILQTIKHDARVPESAVIFIVNTSALTDLIENVFNTPEHVNKLVKISYIPFNLTLMSYTNNQYASATGRSDAGGDRKLFLPSPSTFSKKYMYRPFESAKNIIRKSINGDFTFLRPEDTQHIRPENMTALEQYFIKQPFTSLQVADGTGNVTEYDYKEISSNQTDYVDLRVFGTLGVIPTIAYSIGKRDKYAFNQALAGLQWQNFDNAFSIASDLDTQYIIPSETITIVNDYLSAFLQGNQNSISQQRANVNTNFDMNVNNINADAQRQLAGANLAFNNQNLQRETDITNHNVKNALDQSNNTLGMVGQGFNMASSAIGNLAMGNVGGAVSNALSGGVNMAINQKQFGNTMSANSEMLNNSFATSIDIQNANLQYQQSTINGMKAQNLRNNSINSKMAMDTMNARMLDVKNKPDSISSLTGGTLMNVLYNRYNIFMRVHLMHPHSINRLSNYLLEYGFLANTKESIDSIMNKLNVGAYIQTVNANIDGNIPQTALNEIKTQFNNGIFIWKDIADYRKTERLKNQ